MVATNQQPNTITTLTDTQHLYTFDDTWLDRGVFHLPGQWVVDSRLTPLQSRVQHMLMVEVYSLDLNIMIDLVEVLILQNQILLISLRILLNLIYLHIVSILGCNKQVTLKVKLIVLVILLIVGVEKLLFQDLYLMASDDSVETVRAGGYDLYLGTGTNPWATETSVVDPVDPHVQLSTHTTAAAALTTFGGTGIREGNDVIVDLKQLSIKALKN